MIPPHSEASHQTGEITRKKRKAGSQKGHPGYSFPEVPATNNQGERKIRLAALIRKINYGNRGDQGVLIQGVLMSILRTLQRRRHQPNDTLVEYQQISLRDVNCHPPPQNPLQAD